MAMLIAWVAYGVVIGIASRAIFPARAHGWKSRGVVFSVGGGLVANLLFSGDVFAMGLTAWVGVVCGSLFVLGYALLLRGEVAKRTRDIEGVPVDRSDGAKSKELVRHEPTPPSY